jgi:hypothetical protein
MDKKPFRQTRWYARLVKKLLKYTDNSHGICLNCRQVVCTPHKCPLRMRPHLARQGYFRER